MATNEFITEPNGLVFPPFGFLNDTNYRLQRAYFLATPAVSSFSFPRNFPLNDATSDQSSATRNERVNDLITDLSAADNACLIARGEINACTRVAIVIAKRNLCVVVPFGPIYALFPLDSPPPFNRPFAADPVRFTIRILRFINRGSPRRH